MKKYPDLHYKNVCVCGYSIKNEKKNVKHLINQSIHRLFVCLFDIHIH